jgi:hypothetical protein
MATDCCVALPALREHLAALERGRVPLRRRLLGGSAWVDVTAQEATILRDMIARQEIAIGAQC